MIDDYYSGQVRRHSGKLIVIVARDETLIAQIKNNLAPEGFQILVIPLCKDVLRVAKSRDARLIIIDIPIFQPDDPASFRALHHRFNCPILGVVNGIASNLTRVPEAGIDDYIISPATETKLMEHVRALLKRNGVHIMQRPVEDHEYTISGISINPLSREVRIGSASVNLTPIEFDILLALARQAGLPVSREDLYNQIWGGSLLSDERMVDVHICRLRKKIERDPEHPRLLHVVRGMGYVLKP